MKLRIMAVSSSEPDRLLETSEMAAPKSPEDWVGVTTGGDFGSGVRGRLNRIAGERVAGMQGWLRDGILRSVRLGGSGRRAAAPTAWMLGALLFSGMAVGSAHAQSAGAWAKKGAQAEARDDYDAAFEDFRQAHLKKPKDLRYRTSFESMRFKSANMHVDRGRVLRQSGDADGAINEFARALQIDPGNQAAAQELQVMEKRTGNPNGPAAAAGSQGAAGGAPGSPGNVTVPGMGEETPYQRQMQREISTLDGPVTLQPVSDDPLTLHMVQDTEVVYQAICKAAGLNVIFDPEYVPKRIPVDLNDV